MSVTSTSVTPDIIMVNPLTNLDPTVTHSDIAAAGVVDAKVKSIGSCTGSHTASHNGICSAYKLIGYTGKVNGCAATVVDPGILSTHNRYVGIGNSSRGVPNQDTIGDTTINPQVVGVVGSHSETLGAVAHRHGPSAFECCSNIR